jgi:hypothetical protein
MCPGYKISKMTISVVLHVKRCIYTSSRYHAKMAIVPPNSPSKGRQLVVSIHACTARGKLVLKLASVGESMLGKVGLSTLGWRWFDLCRGLVYIPGAFNTGCGVCFRKQRKCWFTYPQQGYRTR